jgi:hypothetical protein
VKEGVVTVVLVLLGFKVLVLVVLPDLTKSQQR